MRTKFLALFAFVGITFSTFAQVPNPETPRIEIVVDQNGNNPVQETPKQTTVEEGNLIMQTAKSARGKEWSDRSLAGKILMVTGAVLIIAFAIIAPNGWNSRSGI